MTPKFQPTLRAVSAAALALTGSFCALPAFAGNGPEPATTGSAAATPASVSATPLPSPPGQDAPSGSATPAAESPTAPLPSDAGLAKAVLRDLGMTLAEFNAAGEQARRAADALPSLQKLPRYVAVRLEGGKIVIEGAGTALQSRVDQLNNGGPADFVLAAPARPASAAASSAPALLASSTKQLFDDYVREVGPAGLQAVAYGGGHFVIRTGGINTAETAAPATSNPQGNPVPSTGPTSGAGRITPAAFVARYANVQLEKAGHIKSEEDLFGGQGLIVDGGARCSVGFGAFSPTGNPAVLTAGHCAGDGSAQTAEIEESAGAQAGGGGFGKATGLLGSFGFSQFGGPGNSNLAPGGTEVGTDIAVLQAIRPDLKIQPAATRWDNPGGLGVTAVKIVGTVAPSPGQPVCRSGRTTGWRCGTIDSVGIWAIPGKNSLPPNYDNDLRPVQAFDSTTVTSAGGDSGGPWITGNFAVGTHTGAETKYDPETRRDVQIRAIATTLEDSLSRIPGGVELQLFLNKPELVGPEGQTVTAGQPISGHVAAAPASAVAANSKVRVTVAGDHAEPPFEVPVDASGNWSFPAPPSTGPLQFSAETVNGFSRSGKASFSIQVSSLAAPVIASPAEGAALKSIDHIDGTGTPGLTVQLSGDVTGRDTVSADGRWSITVSGKPVYGQLTVTATQVSPQHTDSPPAIRNFSLAPPAPGISTVREGAQFEQESLPGTISGTGVESAEVTVSIDGTPAGTAWAEGGRWSMPFPSGLAPGQHSISASQAVEGVVSEPFAVMFTISAAVVPAAPPAGAGPAAPVGPAALAAPAVPAAPSAGTPDVPASDPVVSAGTPSGPDQLAHTGPGFLLPAAGLAAASFLVGALLLVLAQRKRVAAAPQP